MADAGEVRGASEEDGLGQQNFLLGSDWQVEVTQLVKDSLRVADPNIVQLLDGQVLIGVSAGTTKLQVVCVCVFWFSLFSPTSCSYLPFSIWVLFSPQPIGSG